MDNTNQEETQQNIELSQSNRNRLKLLHDGYGFVYDRQSADGQKMFWRCEERGNYCKARIHSSAAGDLILKTINEHNHGSNVARTEMVTMRSHMKRRAVQTVETPSQIFNSVIQNVSVAVQEQLPSRDASRKMIQRKRNESDTFVTQPVSLESLVIPESFQRYEYAPGQSEQFLLSDSEVGNANRILMFGRESHGEWIHHTSCLYVDGTFSLAPPLFSQVFVIMAEREGFVHQVVYFLLPNKQRTTYTRAFEMLHETWPNLHPTAINLDFEIALIDSARIAYPNANINGCLFHLTRNMRLKLTSEGLTRRYNTEPTFSLQCRMIVALAFVPVHGLVSAFDALAQELPVELNPILDWLEDNYIGRLNRDGTRRTARFPPDIWSVYERTLNDDPRTNNHAEAAHRRLQSEFSVDHPSIWKFIDGIRMVQKGRDAFFERFIRGDAPPIKRRKYVLADQRIKRIVENYPRRNILEYLRGIAHNFLME